MHFSVRSRSGSVQLSMSAAVDAEAVCVVVELTSSYYRELKERAQAIQLHRSNHAALLRLPQPAPPTSSYVLR